MLILSTTKRKWSVGQGSNLETPGKSREVCQLTLTTDEMGRGVGFEPTSAEFTTRGLDQLVYLRMSIPSWARTSGLRLRRAAFFH